jgi:hypothetical protein
VEAHLGLEPGGVHHVGYPLLALRHPRHVVVGAGARRRRDDLARDVHQDDVRVGRTPASTPFSISLQITN